MLLAVLGVWFLGWLGYTYFGMKKVAVMAMIGGGGILPIMVTVLVLILMESDALHQATSRHLSKSVVKKYPYPDDVVVVEYDNEDEASTEVGEEGAKS
jgi:hypothetical protein